MALFSPPSEPEIDNWLLEGVHVHGPQGGLELFVGAPGQEAVERALEVGDAAFGALREAHVREARVVQAALLARQVGEVLRGNGWDPLVVVGPGLRWGGRPR